MLFVFFKRNCYGRMAMRLVVRFGRSIGMTCKPISIRLDHDRTRSCHPFMQTRVCRKRIKVLQETDIEKAFSSVAFIT